MHPPEVKAEALALAQAGLNDCEVSRRLGIPRGTIRDWRRPSYVSRRTTPLERCPRCWRSAKPMRFTADDYSELLGLYLGDGCISESARTQRLRLHLDAKYPRMNDEIRALLRRCFPENPLGEPHVPVSAWSGRSDTLVILSIYSRHLGCLFPQHGTGRKHERTIRLESWQWRVVQAAPWAFLRGCIRSDGCAFINRTDIHRAVPYEYLSYAFSNRSKNIVDLFTRACELAGVHDYRVSGKPGGCWSVRINRRDSVALMREHVGLKH
jgi:transposase-like protein